MREHNFVTNFKLLIILGLCLSGSFGAVYAADLLWIDDVTGCNGDTIIVPVMQSNGDTAYSVFGMDVQYDTQMLTYVEGTNGTLNPDNIFFYINEYQSGSIRVGWMDYNVIPVGSNGSIALLTFTVNCSTCTSGSNSLLSFSNLEDGLLDFTATSGRFTYLCPTPTPLPTINAWHIPASAEACSYGATMRNVLNPQVTSDPVCLYAGVYPVGGASAVTVYYRINSGSWLTQAFTWTCNHNSNDYWWTKCDVVGEQWIPGAAYGDTVYYYIEVTNPVNTTTYLYSETTPAQTSVQSVAQADPYHFTYPAPTDTPTPIPPTDTPLPTDTPTPIPPTDTPLPTDTPTPLPPTETPTEVPPTATSTPTGTCPYPLEVEGNDTCEDATTSGNTIGCGELRCGAVDGATDLNDYFKLEILTSQTIYVSVFGNSSSCEYPFGMGLDPYVALLNFDCSATIADGEDAYGDCTQTCRKPEGWDAQVTANLDPGTYFIRITSMFEGWGPYVVEVCCEAPPTPTPTPCYSVIYQNTFDEDMGDISVYDCNGAGDHNWQYETGTFCNDMGAMRHTYNPVGSEDNDWAITGPINIQNQQCLTLEFSYDHSDYLYEDCLSVYISCVGGSPCANPTDWRLVWGPVCEDTSGCVPVSLNICELLSDVCCTCSNIYLGFQYTGEDQFMITVDDILLHDNCCGPGCIQPTVTPPPTVVPTVTPTPTPNLTPPVIPANGSLGIGLLLLVFAGLFVKTRIKG